MSATPTTDAPLRKRDLAIPFVQKELLQMYGFTGIRHAKAQFPDRTREDVFERLRLRYNAGLRRQARSEVRRAERRATFEVQRQAAREQRRIAREQQAAAARRAVGIQRTAAHVVAAEEYHAKRAFKSAGGTFHQADHIVYADGNITLADVEHQIRDELFSYFNQRPTGMLMLANVIITYVKEREDHPDIQMHFHRPMFEAFRSAQFLEDYVADYMRRLVTHIEDGERGPSGYTFKHFELIRVQTKYVNPPRGGTFIDLPPAIKNKKCCVNIHNDDNRCFDYALLAYFHHDEIGRLANRTEGKYYRQFIGQKVHIPEDMSYPVKTADISKYEKLNDFKIIIYVLDEDNKPQVLYNRRSCSYDTQKAVIPLLLLQREDGEAHYVLIKNMSRLLGSRATDDNGKKHYCLHCLAARFSSEAELAAHVEICTNHEGARCVLPKEGSTLSFRNHGRRHRHPFYVTADFESTLEKVADGVHGETHRHVPNSFAIKFCCIHEEHSMDVEVYTAPTQDELIKLYIERLEQLALHAHQLLQASSLSIWQMMHKPSSPAMQQHYAEACAKHARISSCEDCGKPFSDEKGSKKCMHHDHITGEYLATLCSKCNLDLQQRRFLPVYMHNSKGYDSHFIVPHLYQHGAQGEGVKVSVIASNEEKYISFSKTLQFEKPVFAKKSVHVGDEVAEPPKKELLSMEIRFLDTVAFMPASLASLTENLKSGLISAIELRKRFPNMSHAFQCDDQFLLMCQKGVYPYEAIDRYSRLAERSLPPIEKFYSQLNREGCSVEEYSRAQEVWRSFNCQTFWDYHELYLKADVLLLADIWASFTNVCHRIYNLDPTYYYTSPGLSWDAMLKHTGVLFELLTDMDMYLMFEGAIRGGLSQISKRYAKANNPAMGDAYDENEEESHILYLDANNLYGVGMSQFLPTGDFKWNKQQWTVEKVMALDDHGSEGYLFEVDIHYPQHLHDLHNGYPLCPEQLQVKNAMLSEMQQSGRRDGGTAKLCTSFFDKKKYSVNYRMLKEIIRQGLVITQFHRVISYEQDEFMASYIQKNTRERARATNDFEKDFYKLMNNSVFGKTMENVRGRINFVLATDNTTFRNKLVRFTTFSDTCIGIHLLKREVKLNKPIYVGQCILDDSKLHMYRFHYNFMMKHFPRENIDLLFTDTDSLCYHIRNEDPDDVMRAHPKEFDFSEYSKNHPLYSTANKKVIGKMKNECPDGQITKFVGLRSKLYAYKTSGGKEAKRCKGVKRVVVKKDLQFDKYHAALMNPTAEHVAQHGMATQLAFRSRQHNICTEQVTKIALSAQDDKVYIRPNLIDTYSHGHYKIVN